MQKEAELIESLKMKDKTSMELFYRSNFASLYKFIRFKVNSNAEAEDITAEAFIRAFEAINKFKGNSSLKTWLYAIGLNLLKEHYKKAKSNTTFNDEISEDKEDIINDYQETQNSHEIKRILSKLKENYRIVLEYRFLSKLSVRETADLMNISENNVKVLQNRAIKAAQKLN